MRCEIRGNTVYQTIFLSLIDVAMRLESKVFKWVNFNVETIGDCICE